MLPGGTSRGVLVDESVARFWGLEIGLVSYGVKVEIGGAMTFSVRRACSSSVTLCSSPKHRRSSSRMRVDRARISGLLSYCWEKRDCSFLRFSTSLSGIEETLDSVRVKLSLP